MLQQYRTHHPKKKKRMFFCFSDFGIFGGEMTSESSRQILFFFIIGYPMIISERTHHKDAKSEKKLKYAYPPNSVLKFEFPAILYTCTRTGKSKGPSRLFLVFGSRQFLINLILIPHPIFLTQ